MPGHDVVIAGVGLLTAVGLSSDEVAASVRAGIARFTESEILDRDFQPVVLAQVPEEGLPEDAAVQAAAGATSRERRMLRLATPALRECLSALPQAESPPPLLLALPETVTTRPLDAQAFLARLAAQPGAGFDAARSEVEWKGRAGGLAAIGRAVEQIRAGQYAFAIAGGVDTYRDLYVLAQLEVEQRVKTPANLDGFIPGEGAGFVLLAAAGAAAAHGLVPVAGVSGVALGQEPGHLYSEEPYRGEGLAETLAALITAEPVAGPIGEVFSSMNGESYWAKEWGVARIRHAGAFAEAHGMVHPADCFGDTGAAAGPLLAGLAALGVRDGHCRGPCLVYGSSDHGERAALLVDRT